MTLFEAPGPAADDDPEPGTVPDAGAQGEGTAGDPSAAGPDGGEPGTTLRLVVAYDGTDFHGFARQPAARTVGGLLADALGRVVGQPVELTCAGRTDAGVHAWAQVVSVGVAGDDHDPSRIARSVTRQLGPEVVVRAADVVDPAFDARRAARWRRYHYLVVNRPVPDPTRAGSAWWVEAPLDLHRLRLAADPFVGDHDFACFCRKGPEGSTTRRTVLGSRWEALGDGLLRYEVTARAFCWQMVRSIVGTMVEAGRGRLAPGEVLGLLRDPERPRVPTMAPPHGLTLAGVGYEGWSTDDVAPTHAP